MRLYLFTFYFLFLSWNLFSQTVAVSGKVVDNTGIEVSFASIVFTKINDSMTTYGTLGLEDGSFSLTLKKDNYSVQVSVVGLVSKTFGFDLSNSKDTMDLGKLVIESETQLDEVVVRNTTSAVKLGLDKSWSNHG